MVYFQDKVNTEATHKKLNTVLKQEDIFYKTVLRRLKSNEEQRTCEKDLIEFIQKDRKVYNDMTSKAHREIIRLTYGLKQYLKEKYNVDIGEIRENIKLIPSRGYKTDIYLELLNFIVEVDMNHANKLDSDNEKDEFFVNHCYNNILRIRPLEYGIPKYANTITTSIGYISKENKKEYLKYLLEFITKKFQFRTKTCIINEVLIILDYINGKEELHPKYFLTDIEKKALYETYYLMYEGIGRIAKTFNKNLVKYEIANQNENNRIFIREI